jgi:hypothetical protein
MAVERSRYTTPETIAPLCHDQTVNLPVDRATGQGRGWLDRFALTDVL